MNDTNKQKWEGFIKVLMDRLIQSGDIPTPCNGYELEWHEPEPLSDEAMVAAHNAGLPPSTWRPRQ